MALVFILLIKKNPNNEVTSMCVDLLILLLICFLQKKL